MPALVNEPWRGSAMIRLEEGAEFREVIVSTRAIGDFAQGNATTWEGTAGGTLTINVQWRTSAGVVTSGAFQVLEIQALVPGAALGTIQWTIGTAGVDLAASGNATRTFRFDTTPLDTTTQAARCGMQELYVRARRTSLVTYDVDSRGTFSSPPAGSVHTWARGYVRAPLVLSSLSVSNVSLGGAEPDLWAYPDTIFLRANLTNTIYESITPTFQVRDGSSNVRSQSPPTGPGLTFNVTFSSPINNSFDHDADDIRLLLPSSTFGGSNDQRWAWVTQAAQTTPDSAATNHGTLVGTTPPSRDCAPAGIAFGKGIKLDGVNLGTNSSGINCGTGVPDITGAFSLEAWFRPAAIGADQVIAGRYGDSLFLQCYVLFVTEAGKLCAAVRETDTTEIVIIGETTLEVDQDYHAAMTYDGTALRLFLDGESEGEAGLASVQVATTTEFWIGREHNATTGTTPPFPFSGVIDEVRLSNVARYTAPFTPAAAPFSSDANTLGLWHLDSFTPEWHRTNERTLDVAGRMCIDPFITFASILQINSAVFATPPESSTAISASGQRLSADLGFLAARATNARDEGLNGLEWTEKLWDTQELTGSDPVPTAARACTGSTQGGEDGWADGFLTWDEGLPGGSWQEKQQITTSGATGLEQDHERDLTLVAADPRISAVVGGGFLTRPEDHWSPGYPLTLGAALIQANVKIAHDADSAKVSLVRMNPATGTTEFLNGSLAWVTGDTFHQHLMPASGGDAKLALLTFTAEQTVGWNHQDLFLVAELKTNGTPYFTSMQLPALATANPHGANQP